jgi:hypothetical protein
MEAEIAKHLISTGNEKFMWVGIGIVLIQIVLIPMLGFLFKYHSKVSNEKIEAQREVSALKRDGQFAAFDRKLNEHILQDSHKQEENNRTLESICNAIEKIGNKVDKLYAKAYNID